MESVSDRPEPAQDDIDAIAAVALDYLEGYVSGDSQRHLRSYHPEAVKRRYSKDEDGIFGIVSLSPQTMADYAATESGTDTGGSIEVIVDDVYEDIASVRVYSVRWLTSSTSSRPTASGDCSTSPWHRRGIAPDA